MKRKTLLQILVRSVAEYGKDEEVILNFLSWYEERWVPKDGHKKKHKKEKRAHDSKSYREVYLKSPVWYSIRDLFYKEQREKNGGVVKCSVEGCVETEVTGRIDPHHTVYRETWMYDPTCTKGIVPLCRKHHDEVEKLKKDIGNRKKATQMVISGIKPSIFIKKVHKHAQIVNLSSKLYKESKSIPIGKAQHWYNSGTPARYSRY